MTTEDPKKETQPEGEEAAEEVATEEVKGPPEPPPDPLLQELYNSTRPSVQLVKGIGLSPIVCSVWPSGTPEALLGESWIQPDPEPVEGEEPPPSFNPAAPEYNIIPRRVAKTAIMEEWNQGKKELIVLEKKVEETPDKETELKEELTAQLAAMQEHVDNLDGQLTEIKSSYEADALSLVPWMNTLFALADAGMTSFDVSGPSFPHYPLQKLFGESNTLDMFAGVEKMLVTFKRRYEAERGPDKIQIFTKLIPNIFTDAFTPTLVTEAIDRQLARMELQQLDMVQIMWWDFNEKNMIPTLKALKALTLDDATVNPETGEVTLNAPAKVRAIGLLNFPYRAILDAIQMGIPVTLVQIEYGMCNRSAEDILSLCAKYGIKVVARNGTLGGLINEKYLGVESPDSLIDDPDLCSVAECLDLVQRFGGWEKLQDLLDTLKKIGDKHTVSMQSVALRFQMDQGTFPLSPVNWEPFTWMPYGNPVWLDHKAPGVDHKLFHKASFLDEEDLALIGSKTS